MPESPLPSPSPRSKPAANPRGRVNLDGNLASHLALRMLGEEDSRWQRVVVRDRRYLIDCLVNNAIIVAVSKREHAGVATEGFC